MLHRTVGFDNRKKAIEASKGSREPLSTAIRHHATRGIYLDLFPLDLFLSFLFILFPSILIIILSRIFFLYLYIKATLVGRVIIG